MRIICASSFLTTVVTKVIRYLYMQELEIFVYCCMTCIYIMIVVLYIMIAHDVMRQKMQPNHIVFCLLISHAVEVVLHFFGHKPF